MNLLEQEACPAPPSYRKIQLSQGQLAVIDDADFPLVAGYKWYAVWSKTTRSYYAYAHPRNKESPVAMHRLLLGLMRGDKREAEHQNHDTLDNRRSCNLREASHAQNGQNRRRKPNVASGFKGVRYQDGRWLAYIVREKKQVRLGLHATPELAHAAYCKAAVEHYGEFACFG